MVDSGPEGNFIDQELACQSGFPGEPLPEPSTARALDGQILAHVTTPLRLMTSGNYGKEMAFKLISDPYDFR